jgi:hypothetical protein
MTRAGIALPKLKENERFDPENRKTCRNKVWVTQKKAILKQNGIPGKQTAVQNGSKPQPQEQTFPIQSL